MWKHKGQSGSLRTFPQVKWADVRRQPEVLCRVDDASNTTKAKVNKQNRYLSGEIHVEDTDEDVKRAFDDKSVFFIFL